MNAKELLDHRNMMIAVKRSMVPREAFHQALVEQRRLYYQKKSYTPLSQILVESGVISESQAEEILGCVSGKGSGRLNACSIPASASQEGGKCPLSDEDNGNGDGVDKNCYAVQSEKAVTLTTTKDGLAAFLSVAGSESDVPRLEDVHQLLNSKGIIDGVIADQEIVRQLEDAVSEKTSFTIATGLPPEQGEPDRVTYHFDTNPFRVGTVTEDGLMDWKERGEYPYVEKETVLATVTPGKKSIPGKDIFGQVVPADEIPRLHLYAGKGVAKSKDRLQLIARVSGQPQLSGRGNVSVLQTLEIKGDIGIETGHVDFDGHIEVRGAVQKGYRVKADSLRAKEILSDAVEISGDVVALRGVFGAHIRCDGRLKANHINKSKIMAEGDVVVAKEVVECRIMTNGKCIVDGGTILSSEIYAKKGLKAGAVGSEAAHPSKLIVGIDQIAKIRVSEYKNEINENNKNISALEEKISALSNESDQINTQLGEIAQVQDGYIVARRKITDLLVKENRKPSAEEESAVADFDVKIAEIDKVVEDSMARDEKAQTQLDVSRSEVSDLKDRNDKLTEEIKDTEQRAEQDMGIPVIQVSGRLYQRTNIEGPHDKLTIEKTMNNATLKEQKNTEKEAEKPYFFKISHR